MGLDSGAYVKSNKRKITRDMLPNGIFYPFDIDYEDEVEFIYFRKCWGLRTEIMDHFGWRLTNPEQWKFDIDTPEQVFELIEILASWLNKERWEDEGNSIWTYEEIHNHLIEAIINTSIIYTYMLNNPDVYIQWYDSY